MSIRTQSRYRTPPYTSDLLAPQSVGSDRSSRPAGSSRTSPSSIDTQSTTPPRSPAYHNRGRDILPRIRKQDQMLDPIDIPPAQYHRREASTSNAFPMNYHQYVAGRHFDRRSASPGELALITPVSAVSYVDSCSEWSRYSPPPNALEVPMACGTHSRSVSTLSMPGYVHPDVTSAPDEKVMARYAYPTYRQAPIYHESDWTTPARTSGMPQLIAQPMPLTRTERYPPPATAELLFESYAEDTPTTTLLKYLTQPNPTPALVGRVPSPNSHQDMHFWWDIRNIRLWTDFTLDTIKKIPDFTKLLEQDILEPLLPAPAKQSLHPDTPSALHDCHTAHYLVKVNAALKVSLPPGHHLVMRATKPSTQAGATQLPEYVSNHSEDMDIIPLGGQPKGRVIGLVRSWEQWNSGMRTESPTSKISYLRELAHLQKHMRDHSCRYGFIITEIELVCVRMGSRTTGHPVFGLLELATPIQLDVSGKDALTAPLALWYLHMLAKNTPLPGQCHWKVEIGSATDRSRANVIDRDAWINLKPECKEKRVAKRNRGWALPEDKVNRRESSTTTKRWTKRKERERLERSQGASLAY